MKLKQLILISTILVLCAFSLTSAEDVWVDVAEVDGLVDGCIPLGGADLTIPLRFTNPVAARSCISNGFLFSSADGVTWDALSGSWNEDYPWNLAMAFKLMDPNLFFDVGLYINFYDASLALVPVDTVPGDPQPSLTSNGAVGIGFAGLSNSGIGLPLGFDDIACYITITGVTGDAGDVLTMDSSFWKPANVWLWCSAPTYYPTWAGPYEFRIADHVDFANGGALPTAFSLRQNYPNPFNPTTDVHFDVPTRSHVKIEIFNVLGHKVETLVDEEMGAGSYVTQWNGTNSTGKAVASGVYLYKMEAGSYVETRKMMMLK